MDKLISFIIPVYNTEKYLEECINSILDQINDKCEIILIDDGSTDNSGLICDSYAAINHEIKVVHQENRGLAAARNIGLDHANGEYIAFVDSDDYLDSSCVTKILKWILWGGGPIFAL